MIVPEFWAEARIRKRFPDRQITVRRFGWSDESQEAAQAHAEQRAAEAIRRIADGEALPRRELRRGYNGADGTPIREEIVRRIGDCVITRNAYGALCLNTPDVLFADVDVDENPLTGLGLTFAVAAAAAAVFAVSMKWNPLAALIAGMVTLLAAVWLAAFATALLRRVSGGPRQAVRRRIVRVLQDYSNWRIRLYSTPAGFRLLVTSHRLDPNSEETATYFARLGVDAVYARMCRRQNCFRARISPKPWRIGMERHISPRTGTWPPPAESLPLRRAWIIDYENLAVGYASCRFEEEFGTMPEDSAADSVRRLHDEYCQALSDRPLA